MNVTSPRPPAANKERRTPEPESALVLILDSDRYVLEVLPAEAFFPRRLLLRKESGREYTVSQTASGLESCTCDGFRHGHRCRHLLGCERVGLLPRAAGGTPPAAG